MTANRIYFDGAQVELGLVPLEGEAPSSPLRSCFFADGQSLAHTSSFPGFAGLALHFGAALSLFAVPQPQPQAAEYQVGSHGVYHAQASEYACVFGRNAAVLFGSVVVSSTFNPTHVAAEQQSAEQPAPQVFGQTPSSLTRLTRPLFATPQDDPTQISPQVRGHTPASLDRLTRIFVGAPEQVEGVIQPVLNRTFFVPVVAQSYHSTYVASESQSTEQPVPQVFGQTPASLDRLTRILSAAPEQLDHVVQPALTRAYFPQVVAAEVPTRPLGAAPQDDPTQLEPQVFGQTPASLDRLTRQLFASPQGDPTQIDSQVFGQTPASLDRLTRPFVTPLQEDPTQVGPQVFGQTPVNLDRLTRSFVTPPQVDPTQIDPQVFGQTPASLDRLTRQLFATPQESVEFLTPQVFGQQPASVTSTPPGQALYAFAIESQDDRPSFVIGQQPRSLDRLTRQLFAAPQESTEFLAPQVFGLTPKDLPVFGLVRVATPQEDPTQIAPYVVGQQPRSLDRLTRQLFASPQESTEYLQPVLARLVFVPERTPLAPTIVVADEQSPYQPAPILSHQLIRYGDPALTPMLFAYEQEYTNSAAWRFGTPALLPSRAVQVAQYWYARRVYHTIDYGVVRKTAGEMLLIGVDFSPVLNTGELLTSIVSGSGAPPGLTVTNLSASGLTFLTRLSGGTVGTRYKLSVVANTSSARVLTRSVYVVVGA